MPDDPMTSDRFAPYVGTLFHVVAAEPPFVMTLREARLLKAGDPSVRAPFALLFGNDDARQLEQGTYAVRHPEIGTVDIFLVPVGRASYEAVFN